MMGKRKGDNSLYEDKTFVNFILSLKLIYQSSAAQNSKSNFAMKNTKIELTEAERELLGNAMLN